MLSLFSCVRLLATPWTVAQPASLSVGFWSGLPCPPPEDLPYPGIEPASFKSPALASGFFITRVTWETQYQNTTLVIKKTWHVALNIASVLFLVLL